MQSLTKTRKGSWFQTFTGKAFWPLDPRPEEIDIKDIAHALAYQCRYAGHTNFFYSVAEHCYFLSFFCSDKNALTALMHDASEAYIVDVPRPLKPFLTNYDQIESALMKVIADKFDFAWPLPDEIDYLDKKILVNERNQFMTDPPWIVTKGLEPIAGLSLPGWKPEQAEHHFLLRFNNLIG